MWCLLIYPSEVNGGLEDKEVCYPGPFCLGSLPENRFFCEGCKGPEELPYSFEIRFRNPAELQANSESCCAIGDFTIRPGFGFSDPDTNFYFGSWWQWNRHFHVTAINTEVGYCCPKGGPALGVELNRSVALESGMLPPLNDFCLVIVEYRRRQWKIPKGLFRGNIEQTHMTSLC